MVSWWGGRGLWPEYVPVATRIARAKKEVEKLRKQGVQIQPVELDGGKIASSFWGKGWCDHMDSFHDYENRLPRGRSYVRNGAVVHLEVVKGKISALVAGTNMYKVEISIELLDKKRWEDIKRQCAGKISSLMDLLKGKLSDGVMRVVASRDGGLFPGPKEIRMRCSCPDVAGMCKHIAAVFYGVGARLDRQPELLFLLRGVDHAELAAGGGVDAVIDKGRGAESELAGDNLAEVFGIEMVEGSALAGTPDAVIRNNVPPLPLSEPRAKRPEKAGRKRGAAAAAKTSRAKTSPVPRRPASVRQDQAARYAEAERLVAEYVAAKKGRERADGR